MGFCFSYVKGIFFTMLIIVDSGMPDYLSPNTKSLVTPFVWSVFAVWKYLVKGGGDTSKY